MLATPATATTCMHERSESLLSHHRSCHSTSDHLSIACSSRRVPSYAAVEGGCSDKVDEVASQEGPTRVSQAVGTSRGIPAPPARYAHIIFPSTLRNALVLVTKHNATTPNQSSTHELLRNAQPNTTINKTTRQVMTTAVKRRALVGGGGAPAHRR